MRSCCPARSHWLVCLVLLLLISLLTWVGLDGTCRSRGRYPRTLPAAQAACRSASDLSREPISTRASGTEECVGRADAIADKGASLAGRSSSVPSSILQKCESAVAGRADAPSPGQAVAAAPHRVSGLAATPDAAGRVPQAKSRMSPRSTPLDWALQTATRMVRGLRNGLSKVLPAAPPAAEVPSGLHEVLLTALTPSALSVPITAVRVVTEVLSDRKPVLLAGVAKAPPSGNSPLVSAAYTPPANGLNAEYYDNSDLTALRVTRVDPTVDFNWDTGQPDGSV
jgi:hypothetical protein